MIAAPAAGSRTFTTQSGRAEFVVSPIKVYGFTFIGRISAVRPQTRCERFTLVEMCVPVSTSGSGQARLMESKPSAWFSFHQSLCAPLGPIVPSARRMDTLNALTRPHIPSDARPVMSDSA